MTPSPRRAPVTEVMAQAFHHAILPLAGARDRRTEIRWGLRDAELRFGHRPSGPVAAGDRRRPADAAHRGRGRRPLHHPGALAGGRPAASMHGGLYRVALGGGRHAIVAFYDGAALGCRELRAERDRRRRAVRRPARVGRRPARRCPTGMPTFDAGSHRRRAVWPPSCRSATLFLESLTDDTEPIRLGLDVTTIGDVLADPHPMPIPIMGAIRDQTSWSCHHGILRWSGECPDAADGRWKRPLRLALERLAAAIDVNQRARGGGPRRRHLGRARHAGSTSPAATSTGPPPSSDPSAVVPRASSQPGQLQAMPRTRLTVILRAQTSRLAMFASDAWFWDDPAWIETAQAMRLGGARGTAHRPAGRHAARRRPSSPTSPRCVRRRPGSMASELYGPALRPSIRPPPAG